MIKRLLSVFMASAVGTLLLPATVSAETVNDSLSLQEVVVTGIRSIRAFMATPSATAIRP